MEKVLFALDIDDEWPPVSSEGVWCDRVDGNYKLLNAPFFIAGLAYGDIFHAEPDPNNGHVFEFEVLHCSGHSVVWVLNNDRIDISSYLERVKALGVKVEGFEQFALYSFDLPPEVDLRAFDSLGEEYERQSLAFAYPTWRHGG